MRVTTNLSLQDYIARGNLNTEALFASDHPVMPLVVAYYGFFADQLWADEQNQPDAAMYLALNAFTLWTGAVRIAMSGHESATYPVLRTALESACYSLVIIRKPDLAPVWKSRHEGELQRKASRKAFGSAVADAAALLEPIQRGQGDFITDLYDAHIDAGAHPNTRGVMDHIHAEPSDGDVQRVGLGSLYPGNSLQVFRALVAVAESARGISMVLTASLPTMPPALADAIRALEAQHMAVFPDAEALPGPARGGDPPGKGSRKEPT